MVSAPIPTDDPELDGTDGAHPAYWRGSDAGYAATCRQIRAVLNGEPLRGHTGADLQAIKEDIAALLRRAEGV